MPGAAAQVWARYIDGQENEEAIIPSHKSAESYAAIP
jgi:hypothetical protein